MWNYSFAIPSLLILSLLLLFYFSLPRLQIRVNKIFLHTLIVESIVILTDILSSYADSNYDSLPLFLVHLLNVLYFAFFFLRAHALFVYNSSALKVKRREHPVLVSVFYIPLVICVVLSFISPYTGAIYSISYDGYHSGPLYNSLYVCSWFYVVMSFILWIRYRRNLRRKRDMYGLLLFDMIIALGILVRWLLPAYLLMDTFCLMAIIVVYLSFENPEFYLDRRGNVFNSSAFIDYIEEYNGTLSNKVIGLVIHNYNEVRDVYGGKQMDEGLTMISRFLIELVPRGIVFYHRRGRFIILCDHNANVNNIIRKIRDRFANSWRSSTADLYLDLGFVSVNMGETVGSADQVLSAIISGLDVADRADSREVITIDKRELDKNVKEAEIRRILDLSLEKNLVEVFLQPLVDAKTNSVVGAEALCRLRDSKGEIIPPAAFIGFAEKNGKINRLGEQVFAKTCKFIHENDIEEMGLEFINVNLSPMQFLRMDLADRYFDIAESYEVDPSMIHLEITEESMIDDSFLQKQIALLEQKGFKFVLDDYGTGYSNLNRLKRCSFINIKLDMSIVWDYYRNPDDILPTMVKAFKQMNFGITSEGIEDEKMAEVMKKIGCDLLQGFYYSKPIPMEEFAKKYKRA
ncbi:MAG: EAL domain-containing protein [Butyrivibrio sp.]|nr:EAL domain-containing protein [Butyrivibrio sp.]